MDFSRDLIGVSKVARVGDDESWFYGEEERGRKGNSILGLKLSLAPQHPPFPSRPD